MHPKQNLNSYEMKIGDDINKEYFIKDQQIARNFVHYMNVFTTPFPSMQMKKSTLFLLQGYQLITIKDWDLANQEILILFNVPLL